MVDLTEIEHKPLPARPPVGHPSVTETLQANIELLKAESTKVEAAAAGHRADFERERDGRQALSQVRRRLLSMAAKEATVRTEGYLAVVRGPPEGETAAVRGHEESIWKLSW